jgi:putative OPT family oligopeptide transporter
MSDATGLTVISVVLALGITFLFTTVSAWAIAMISVTPISGMTVTTIIITAVLLLAAGLPTDTEHQRNLSMLAVLLVGGVVCSGLSMAGTLVTEFKLGFWLGASPRRIQWSAICASLLASVLVTATIMVLAQEPSFDPSKTGFLKAPQANVMASALKSFIGGGEVPWVMYGTGVAVVLLVELIGISGLAFALGMYLPMELNTPILVGAIVAALVRKSSGDSLVSMARRNKGILIASGLIAGGAIVGVLKSVVTLASEKTMEKMDMATRMVASGRDAAEVARLTNWLGIAMFLALCAFVYLDCRRAKPEEAGPEIHM